MQRDLVLKILNSQSKLETFTKLKKSIPSALEFLAMKIKKKIQSMYQNNVVKKLLNCCELLIGEKDKKHYVLIKDFNTFMYDHSLHRGRKHFCPYCLHAFITCFYSSA